MAVIPAPSARRILRLRATILDSDPEIWRTIDVDDALTLRDLHDVLQLTFGWFDSHLHQFFDHDPYARRHGLPTVGRPLRRWVDEWSMNDGPEEGEESDAGTTIGEAMSFDGPLWYEYDFGDGWMHRIDLVDRDAVRPGEPPASLVDGERRAPYEDSGGIGGYAEMLEILADPAHPEHAHIAWWVGTAVGPWGVRDPDDADLDAARAELALRFADPVSPDLSGLVDADTGISPDSPIAEFAASLPVPYRANLRRHVRRTDLLAPVALTDAQAAELIAPFAWLLQRLGSEGLKLTAAGWLPPTFVQETMDALGWTGDWPGEGNREEYTTPVRRLREVAQGLRLIRKVNGRLVAVARALRIADDPQALAAEMARMLLRQRLRDDQLLASARLVIGVADGEYARLDDAMNDVPAFIGRLGYVSHDGRPLDERWFRPLTSPVLDALLALGAWPRGSRRGTAPAPTDAVRAFARVALR